MISDYINRFNTWLEPNPRILKLVIVSGIVGFLGFIWFIVLIYSIKFIPLIVIFWSIASIAFLVLLGFDYGKKKGK